MSCGIPALRSRRNEFSADGVDAKWIVYGDFLGDQKGFHSSALRSSLGPRHLSAQSVLRLVPHQWRKRPGWKASRSRYQSEHGSWVSSTPEIGFMSPRPPLPAAVWKLRILASDPLVLTFDFPQNAHSKTPGGTAVIKVGIWSGVAQFAFSAGTYPFKRAGFPH